MKIQMGRKNIGVMMVAIFSSSRTAVVKRSSLTDSHPDAGGCAGRAQLSQQNFPAGVLFLLLAPIFEFLILH